MMRNDFTKAVQFLVAGATNGVFDYGGDDHCVTAYVRLSA